MSLVTHETLVERGYIAWEYVYNGLDWCECNSKLGSMSFKLAHQG